MAGFGVLGESSVNEVLAYQSMVKIQGKTGIWKVWQRKHFEYRARYVQKQVCRSFGWSDTVIEGARLLKRLLVPHGKQIVIASKPAG